MSETSIASDGLGEIWLHYSALVMWKQPGQHRAPERTARCGNGVADDQMVRSVDSENLESREAGLRWPNA